MLMFERGVRGLEWTPDISPISPDSTYYFAHSLADLFFLRLKSFVSSLKRYTRLESRYHTPSRVLTVPDFTIYTRAQVLYSPACEE